MLPDITIMNQVPAKPTVNFIKALLANELNLNRDKFKSYKELAKFLNDYPLDFTVTENYIAQTKTRGGKYKKVV